MAQGKLKTPAKAHGGDIRGFFAKGSSQAASSSSQPTSQLANGSVSSACCFADTHPTVVSSGTRMERRRAAL